ncbi:MAG: TonB-dependent receptor [Bacteroidales bacterium]|nr:TonB-dependent receptor [Bacteroidales bacterium]
MKQCNKSNWRIPSLILLMLCCCITASAQRFTAKGVVVDSNGEPVIGAAVALKGNETVGVITDLDGYFSMTVDQNAVLVVSFIGMETLEVPASQSDMRIVLKDDTLMLEETIVVGYGQQKKASVVGAITQTTGAVLERAAGVSSIGAALTGNLPGVVTTQSTGMPGEEDPKITIRGSSSWNSSDPLVLVDGIERPMSSVDISSVESISVLKDASATAVYGVKGANGVILVTTKRGQEGKARIDVGFNATMKNPSKLPNKLDSYDALMARNVAIEHELGLMGQDSWEYIRPQSFIENYRNQTTVEQMERYPNVDWQDALFNKFAMSYNANVNVSGGTQFVKYFASADYLNEGDLFKVYPNNRGYEAGYGYDRINVRSNLDFSITPTTTLRVNLAGSSSKRTAPTMNSTNDIWQIQQQWAGAYGIAPDVFLPVYSDGAWGTYPNASNVTNSAENLSVGGRYETTTNRINTDFTLEQDLKFITPGLSLRGLISWDNQFVEANRGVSDMYNNPQRKWIDPVTGIEYLESAFDSYHHFDYKQPIKWNTSGGSVNNWSTLRNLYYQGQINYARTFAEKHDVTAMGLFSRQENATGSMIPLYREDWAFRATYSWNGRYFVEYNGAYNGSEKFADVNRFAFFNSGALGWMISEEPFMKWFRDKRIIEMLKVRASYGEIGDDNIQQRWLYMSQWAYGGATSMDLNQQDSIYEWYRESAIGNPDVKWETVTKLNFGIDYSMFKGLIAGSLEFFQDNRRDILINGNSRSVPSYYGGTPPTVNLGRVQTNGYELELRVNKQFANSLRLWGNFNMTHAENIILQKDDQALRPDYQKEAGYSIGQYRSHIDAGFTQTWDQVYGTPMYDTNDAHKLPGDYYIVDFNGDGVVDSKDSAPYGYTGTPQNTYNATIGFEFKGFSAFAQFYGVTNVTRDVPLTSFGNKLNTVYDMGSWWSAANPNADVVVPAWGRTPGYYANQSTQYLFDGSFVRLKNLEIAYTATNGWIKKIGVDSLKIFLNGNNLWLWTRMPDDREANLSGFGGGGGAYPTVRRFNLGVKLTL